MPEEYNRLLKRQIRRYMKDPASMGELREFLDAVNQSYHEYERQIAHIEHLLEVSSQELMAKNKELERQNDMLETFVYRVTHDLKSPAQNIRNMVTMMDRMMPEKNPMLSNIVSHLSNSSSIMIDRIQELLQMIRVRYKVNEDAIELEMNEIFGAVMETLQDSVQKSSAKIVANFCELPVIFFSRENMFSILQNLVSNAVKYRHPDRAPVITVKSGVSGKEAWLSVSDNGMGMDLEKHGNKLFSMFSRFHDHVEGTGVGLFILKRIMDAQGGRIEVESEVDKGTTFRIWFQNTLVHEKA